MNLKIELMRLISDYSECLEDLDKLSAELK